ncbi:hypothetical protein FB548_2220 [Pseudoxanthomonas sp. 3HH-4]|uniref:hypothetical protein n=1 Tax=Pseudoxanthomonas sp. 3HH-4 TaxID=1690214 RepID=UPI001154B705|nr:hypothetical protein [Pseudoxanthomonas sp. 3HH-4]TQM12287.1 hypothetical protein FB548_2220 [Pseudoxanthomonas sp. 3HH-4]
MSIRYYISLPNPQVARGQDPAFSFSAQGSQEFADQLQAALSHPNFFERWKNTHVDPDGIDPVLAMVDPGARVSGSQQDLQIDLVVDTSLPGAVIKQRMGLLAGNAWALTDITA